MRCDGRTFTETNGSIVSEKADRAVNRGPNTEQININRNSFSDLLGARQQRHQTLSARLSPWCLQEERRARPLSPDLWPLSWPDSWCATGKYPLVPPFSPAIVHHEISFMTSSAWGSPRQSAPTPRGMEANLATSLYPPPVNVSPPFLTVVH